jgi:hydrogenase nickel incorporation protein HypB
MHDILIEEKVLKKNDEIAARNRAGLRASGIFSINMVSSPGSGKTSVIEKTLAGLKERVNTAVIEGDLQTDLDAQRIERLGVPVRQITTGRACHLDAHLVEHALPWVLSQESLELLIIENVGNMVCPAEYDLGEEFKVTVMSVTEGDDKPLKYPAIFAASELLIINKVDLVPHTDFNMKRATENALKVNPGLKVFRTSCYSDEGIDEWCGHLLGCLEQSRV